MLVGVLIIKIVTAISSVVATMLLATQAVAAPIDFNMVALTGQEAPGTGCVAICISVFSG